MKKTLALVLALAMVFSTITVAFAEGTIGADAQVCSDLGMLKGSTGTVDAAYVATAPTRIQAAVMFLRLKGLEAEATAFPGTANFADADKAAWAKPIMAYLKANPQLGWQGDGTNFDPAGLTTAQAYYKVMLETLGYKQTTAEVVGDFAYADVVTFAAGKGLTKVAAVTNFTVNDLATATVEALKANMKDGGKTLVATLVEAGKVDAAKAEAAGLTTPVVPEVTAVLDDATAVGSTEVDVVFEDDVDPSVANVANFAIEGLEITAAGVVASDTIRLDTAAAMTAGKLYTLTVGGKSVKFAGIAKVSGAPEIEKVVSEDVEEVVITFTKFVDLTAGTNVANYSITGVEIAKAEVDENEVTLTTVGLANKTKYTVKVSNMKSIDGTVKKTDSDSFTSKFDTAAPKLATATPETNQRIKVTFNEEVTQETAENLANYAVKVDETDGASLEVVSVEWDSDDENFVFVVTEAMEKNEDYVVSVSGVADQRKAANTMTRPSTKDIKGLDEDEDAPKLKTTSVISPTAILVTFSDDSRIDEASVTDLNNYTLEDLNIESISVVEDEYQIFRVLLTVEELEDSESYDLTVEGVEDEFGNAMDEDKEVVRVTSTNIAAPKPIMVRATGENTIVLSFDGELDEASAENIANYEFDEDLGAPTKAVYAAVDINGDKDKTDVVTDTYNEKYCVTLTVNDMINGLENNTYAPVYDLVLDGVLDLAGNKLHYEPSVDTKTAIWDKDAPELEDVEVVDKYTVALSFDEKVLYGTGAQLILAVNDNEANTITLTAKEITEESTVVEFTYYTNVLTEGVGYSVYKVVYGGVDGGITDLIGNHLLATGIDRSDFAFEGSSEAHEALEIDSYYQKDAIRFEVTFPREVIIVGGDKSVAATGWTVEYKSSNHAIVRFVKDSGIIDENTDYKFDFATLFTDKHGFALANVDDTDAVSGNETTVLTGEYKDEDAPYIEEVVAVDRNTIKITFNERIDEVNTFAASDFSLRNYDLDEPVTITNIGDATNNDGVIELKVTKPLEARYEYELKLDGILKDFAGLEAEKDTFYFDGSNLQN